MSFDPAIAARNALERSQESGELGGDQDAALEAEETFSSEDGELADAAYKTLLEIGEQYPLARDYQAFLIYLTWQQVVQDPVPSSFRKGLELCEPYLESAEPGMDTDQIRQLQVTFRGGLGKGKDAAADVDPSEVYDEDSITEE